MARKRLSDLLREEAQKPAQEETAASSDESNGTQKRTTSTRSRRATSAKTSAKTSTRSSANTSRAAARGAKKQTTGSADSSSADSATETPDVSELKAALETLKQQEETLNQKLTSLQTDLDKQVALVKSLKQDLKKTESLKGELDDAKKAALKLAEENTRLREELSQKSLATRRPESIQAPEPITASAALTQRDIMHKRQAASLAHPVFPTDNAPPGHLSEQDLGWVD